MVKVDKSYRKLFIGLGSNLESSLEGKLVCKEENLKRAIKCLTEEFGTPIASSSVIESEPWGFDSDNAFLNQVVVFWVNIPIHDILKLTQNLEKKLGRLQKSKKYYTDRIIDLDILYYGGYQVDTIELSVPHPKIASRKFVLDSLMEIAPNWVDVRLDKEIREVYNELN